MAGSQQGGEQMRSISVMLLVRSAESMQAMFPGAFLMFSHCCCFFGSVADVHILAWFANEKETHSDTHVEIADVCWKNLGRRDSWRAYVASGPDRQAGRQIG